MALHLPLNALKVFEAAARHGSFRLAADELHVTPAAVSQQIRTLEEYFGTPLFERTGRGITLTTAGVAALPALQQGFELIGQGVEAIRRDQTLGNELVVWAAPSFASKWLIPRLGDFYRSHPDINLRISASDELIDSAESQIGLSESVLRKSNVDVAIRFGRGHYPGCEVHRLLSVDAVPLCSPALLAGELPLRTPDDLVHHTLLHDDTHYEGRPDWASWLRMAGVKNVNTRQGLYFNHVLLALEAAIESQGVVLTMAQLAASDVAAGRLVIPFDLPMPLESAYYIISVDEPDANSNIAVFRSWLLDIASREPEPLSSTREHARQHE